MDIIKTSDLTVNERIRKYRKEKKVSQKRVAEALGMNYTTYSQMEREAKKISSQTLINIAAVLNINPNLLFYGENPIEPDFPEPEPIIAEDPEKGDFTAIVKYKTPEIEITHEERQIIKTFRNCSESQKKKFREIIEQFI